jgi:hyperosmotically inducible periplasmic protein
MGRLLIVLALAIGSLAACQAPTGKTASQTMDDASVTVDVQKKLTSDRAANFTRVEVDTKQGIVQLTGVVQTSEQRARAEELAKHIPGVRGVHNNIQVYTAQP